MIICIFIVVVVVVICINVFRANTNFLSTLDLEDVDNTRRFIKN